MHAQLRRAEIIAVGSEMLGPDKIDTNSLFITERLNGAGVDVVAKGVVGDDRALLADAMRAALSRADLVVVTGGLGPTADDVTREAVADVLGVPLDEDRGTLDRLEKRFASRGMRMPATNRKQAQVPRGATLVDNPNGTAPGLLAERAGPTMLVLPGPPREMKPMLEAFVRERLGRTGRGVYRRVLKTTGRPESRIDEIAHPVYEPWAGLDPPIRTTVLAVPGQIELHLTLQADDPEVARAALDEATAELAAVLGPALFSTDGRRLEEVVGGVLRERRLTIATAESCTGGLLCSRLTDVPGSSDYVERGVVCYSNRAKVEMLGVREELIRDHGAVSEPVGLAMALGIRDRAGVSIGVGITGIAGPGGGTPAKRVGTVVVAIAWDGGERVITSWFPGDRDQVKFHASQAALDMVRRYLIGV